MASRSIDISVAAIALVVLSPLYLLISSIVKLTSSGPVHFHQERIGLHGQIFRIHKFRSMRADALNSGVNITIGGDPRITATGHLLRRLKLDELPQLFNVLTGDMSLVGPRPEVARYVALYPEPLRTEVLSVRPGLTDLASLCFMDESRLLGRVADPERFYVEKLMPLKLKLAAAYVRHRSAWLDLRIIAATLTGILGWRWIPAPWSAIPEFDLSPNGEPPRPAKV